MPARRKKQQRPIEHEPHANAEATLAVEPTPEVRPDTATDARTQPAPSAPAEGEPRRQWQPDPFALMSICLGAEKDSPKMTLFRSNKLNQVAIRFDEKPGDEHRARLRDAGWRWREAEGVWTKQLDRERRAASHLEAERLFTEIGDAIRAERGLSGRAEVGG